MAIPNLTLKVGIPWDDIFPYFAGVTFALGKVQQHTYVIKSYRTAMTQIYSIAVTSDLIYVFRFLVVDSTKLLGIMIIENGNVVKHFKDGSQQAYEITRRFHQYLKLYEPIMVYGEVK